MPYNNIALCYHGFTENSAQKLPYVTYVGDFTAQIEHLLALGYSFVKPSVFSQAYQAKTTSTPPLAVVILDDALASVKLVTPWLSGKAIPFGIAVIGQRLGRIEPEDDYLSWQELNTMVNSGWCEILDHTYNMHHFCLRKNGTTVELAPILEGPCYVETGEFVYISPSDPRWYWDLSHVTGLSWGFPIFGTDPNTGKLITSTIQFKPKADTNVDKIRLWTCLHSPAGSGYNAQIEIKFNGVIAAKTTVKPVQYDTRTQWPERELVTVSFSNSITLKAGQSCTMQFVTKNTGSGAFRIFAIPEFSQDFHLSSTCTGMDFTPSEKWPAKACVILAGANGANVSEDQYAAYVREDLNQNRVAPKYLSTGWDVHSTEYIDSEYLYAMVLAGTYSDNTPAGTIIKFRTTENFTAEVLRIKCCTHLGQVYPLVVDVLINETNVARFAPNWMDWRWQTINITPYDFIAGQDYAIRFETKNTCAQGQGLIRIYMDQAAIPPLTSNPGGLITPADFLYEVKSLEGTDCYPTGVYQDNTGLHWQFTPPYGGPGKTFLELLSCVPASSPPLNLMCYPFGSYYSTEQTQTGSSSLEDIHPVLKNLFTAIGINSGFAVWDEPVQNMSGVYNNYSQYVIPRYAPRGDTPLATILQEMDTYIGV